MKRNMTLAGAALLIAGLTIMAGCSKDSSNPAGNDDSYSYRIVEVTAVPDTIDPGASTLVTCTAEDDSGATLYYDWDANDQGHFSGLSHMDRIAWFAPDSAGTYPVTVFVSDSTSPSTRADHVEQTINIVVEEGAAANGLVFSNPIPADGSTLNPFPTTFSWDCTNPDSAQLVYSVHYGTDNPPTTSLVEWGTTTSCPAPEDLQGATTYYWQVTVTQNGIRTDGPVWSFTTGGSSATFAGHTWDTAAQGSEVDGVYRWRNVDGNSWAVTFNNDGTYQLSGNYAPDESGTYTYSPANGTAPAVLSMTHSDTTSTFNIVDDTDGYMVLLDQGDNPLNRVLVKANEHLTIVTMVLTDHDMYGYGTSMAGENLSLFSGDVQIGHTVTDDFGLGFFTAPQAYGSFEVHLIDSYYNQDPLTFNMRDDRSFGIMWPVHI